MPREQVEHVTRTFCEAMSPGKWHDAPGRLSERFRSRTRIAIATLNRQIAECRSAAEPGDMTYSRDTTAISELTGHPMNACAGIALGKPA